MSDESSGVAQLPIAGQPSRRTLTTVKVHARDTDFRVVQVQGNLFVCAVDNCCCGHGEKGRPDVPVDRYQQEWDTRRLQNRVHLTFTGCLGPCVAGNNALLQIFGRSIWLADLNDSALVPAIYDYIEAMLAAGRVVAAPEVLRGHIYNRYAPRLDDGEENPVPETVDDGGGLERIDPVCLMDVDPATARFVSEYQGRRVYFCAPACKRAFDRDPEAYALA